MDLPQKLALVVQPNRLQGLIWQALLRSQKLSVILEAPNGDLPDCISQISGAGLTLPDLIVLDAETPGINPYEFCRWCREHFPNINVFLTRIHVQPLSETEQRWAQKQGATGFLDGFNRATLMSTAVANLKAILSTLDEPFLDERALLTVLLNIRRQIGTTAPAVAPVAAPAPAPTGVKGEAPVVAVPRSGKPEPKVDTLHDPDWVASGLRSLNQSKEKAEPQDAERFAPIPFGFTPGVAKGQDPADSPKSAVPVRRYRGVAY